MSSNRTKLFFYRHFTTIFLTFALRTPTANPNKQMKALLIAAIAAATAVTAHADDWMARVPDSTPVCRITMPGTHDAATGDGFACADSAVARVVATTQELPLSRQWAAGVRAFDLRPAVRTMPDGTQQLHIYHGEFATRLTMDAALSLIADSLAAHPTEFAIVVMRHEASASRDESRWPALMGDILARHATVLADFSPSITVGEMRGKILLISRDRYEGPLHGAYAEGWRHDADFWRHPLATLTGKGGQCPLAVQDFYDTSAPGAMKKKLRAIDRMIKAARKAADNENGAPVWTINHASGYALTADIGAAEPVSLSDGYRANAAATNAHLLRKASKGGTKGAGIVMTDYAGTDISGTYRVMGLSLVNALCPKR